MENTEGKQDLSDNSVREDCGLTEEELDHEWTFHELRHLIIKEEEKKLDAIFTRHPIIISDLLGENDMSLTFVAVERNAKFIIKLFIKHGFDPFEIFTGNTVFHCAASYGRLHILKLLLKYKPEGITSLDVMKRTLLHNACEYNYPGIVEYLVQTPDCHVNAKDEDGFTGLHLACAKGHADCVTVLCKTDQCDVNAHDPLGQTALHLACENGHPECVKVLLKHPDIDSNFQTTFAEDGDGFQIPLHVACYYGHAECVRLLVHETNCDVNVRIHNGKTSLHIACENNNVECVKYLLQHPNIQSDKESHEGKLPEEFTDNEDIKTLLKNFKE